MNPHAPTFHVSLPQDWEGPRSTPVPGAAPPWGGPAAGRWWHVHSTSGNLPC
jgi:hypothetical protein